MRRINHVTHRRDEYNAPVNQMSDQIPVDEAIKDGGWMLLNRDWKPERNRLAPTPIDIILAEYPEFSGLVVTG